MRFFFLAWAFFLPCQFLFAQTKPYAYKAQVIHAEAHVFEKPDFDSKVIATLEEGKVFDVSQQLISGAFYKIRLRPGVLGYVSDADIRPLWKTKGGDKIAAQADEKSREKKIDKKSIAKNLEKKKTDKRKRPFQYTQFVGLQYASIEYQEDTMGSRRREPLGFFGVKLSGPDLIVEGIFPTEVNFLFHSGAPTYYEKLTGHSADGWIFLMDFLWESYFPQGKNALTFIGFGPMLRYSKFNVSVTDATTLKTQAYSLEDIGVGGVFNAGIAVKMDQVSLRGEAQYYWEKQPYWGVGLSLQMAF
ncbi:MAG: SH3 domain-containing protein [Pseudobdellovibrionaceae bacterium]